MVHSVGPASAQGLALLAQPSWENGPWHRRYAHVERGQRVRFARAVAHLTATLWRPVGSKVLL
jgi:hypothetical protein